MSKTLKRYRACPKCRREMVFIDNEGPNFYGFEPRYELECESLKCTELGIVSDDKEEMINDWNGYCEGHDD